MANKYAGTQTEKNLEAAFAGEDKSAMVDIMNDANAKWAATRDANADLEAYLANECGGDKEYVGRSLIRAYGCIEC